MTAAQTTTAPSAPVTDATAGRPATQGTGPGVLLVIGSCISLQFGAAVATQLFPVLGAWGVTTLRIGCAALILLLIARPRVRSWTTGQWKAVVLFGLALAGMNGFFYAAIDRIPLSAAVSVEFMGPLLLAALTSRRAADFVWVLLALLGMGILGLESAVSTALDPLGVVFALIAGAFWMAYILTSAHVGQAVPGTGGLAVAMAVAAVALVPVGGPAALGAFADPKLIGLAVLTGLLASVIPYSLELAALRRVPKNMFSILLSLEPAFAALFGWLLLSQEIGPLRLLTIVLVIGASVGTTMTAASAGRKQRRREQEDAAASLPDTGEEASAGEVVETQPLGTGALPLIETEEHDETR